MSKSALAFTPIEKKASYSLAILFAIRMMGLFLLTPVFAEVAQVLQGGQNVLWVGMALGAYGVTQALMQIPFGMASDRWGRRRIIIIGMILFVLGGVICALSDHVLGVMIGRFVQGLGAVSAAIMAWIADATRPEIRTRAMAMAGGSIGFSFALSLVLSPLLLKIAGLSGLFWTISLLGFLCLLLAVWMVPVVPIHDRAISEKSRAKDVLTHPNLLRLNISVFVLHFCMMALFMAVPTILFQMAGMTASDLWKFYLPTLFIALVAMVPLVIVIEVKRCHRLGLWGSVWGLCVIMLLFILTSHHVYGFAIVFTLFFIMFNLLEAILPSSVSQVATPEHKGMALGFFNMSQALGVASGSAMGGWVISHYGLHSVFVMGIVMSVIWMFFLRGFRLSR
ncbi:MFS transporter [Basilea psittacipulmonis]|uniref:Membrane protein n=1 Tax=Basilea psittacipulmonis DSM 24701 TaxID=1072685 RepID=A0A077DBK6_9BURK|nr:MFS transporter [Basilea psittacipulmonis]AIL32054.1 membrane protein [Basilea psittacipulmonis DSM 24701]